MNDEKDDYIEAEDAEFVDEIVNEDEVYAEYDEMDSEEESKDVAIYEEDDGDDYDDASKELAVASNNYKSKVQSDVEKHSLEDYEFARSSIYDAIEKGHELLDSALAVAKETETPRAVEVASNLVKDLVKASRELMANQEQLLKVGQQMKELNSEPAKTKSDIVNRIDGGVEQGSAIEQAKPADGTVNIQMTTSELITMINNAKKEKEESVIDITPPKE